MPLRRRPGILLAATATATVLAGCATDPGAGPTASTTEPASAVAESTTSAPRATTTTTARPTTTSSTTTVPTTVPTTTVPTVPPAPIVRSGTPATVAAAVGEPLSISIPDIGVASPLVATGLLPDGTVDVPADAAIAGWFTGGPRPGEQGPAVIMGHVDSRRTGPGVFFRLAELPIGAVVTVETTTGPQRFVTQAVERFAKDEFPTDLVYGAAPGATLRLVTCGGSFDRSTGHYRDNVVAFLVPAVA